MSANKHGLGRGIDALFRNSPAVVVDDSETQGSSRLPLAVLRPCPYQPRRVFEDQPLQELAESIRNQGIVQPLLVRPISGGTHYEIVAGERRYRAAKIAGLSEVPVVIRQMSDDEALTAALVENLQREDLNPLEEAEAMHALRERLGESQEALATRIGKSRSAVANALRLLQLPEDMRKELSGNIFTPGHARAVLAIPEEDLQRQLYDAIIAKQLSVRDAESAVQHYKRTGQMPASFASSTETTKQAGPRSVKPELIRDVQNVLRETLGAKVTVSGSGDMGRVTIPYESAEHLTTLMRLLCSGQIQSELNEQGESDSSEHDDSKQNELNKQDEFGQSEQEELLEHEEQGEQTPELQVDDTNNSDSPDRAEFSEASTDDEYTDDEYTDDNCTDNSDEDSSTEPVSSDLT